MGCPLRKTGECGPLEDELEWLESRSMTDLSPRAARHVSTDDSKRSAPTGSARGASLLGKSSPSRGWMLSRTADGAFDGDGSVARALDGTARLGTAGAAVVRSMNRAVADVTHNRPPLCRAILGGQLGTLGGRGRLGFRLGRCRGGGWTWLHRALRRSASGETRAQGKDNERWPVDFGHDPRV